MSLYGWMVVTCPDPDDLEVAGEAALGFLRRFGRGEPRLSRWPDCLSVVADLRAHRALPTEAFSADDGVVRVLAFDGWVENAPELAEELALPEDAEPARLVAAIHHEWGPAGFARLLGEYSFVLQDRRDGSFHAVRDKLGVRPLFEAGIRDGIAWSNLPGLLAALPQVGRELDEVSAAHFLCGRSGRLEDTLYRSVKRILGGCARNWRPRGEAAIERYWRPAQDVLTIEATDAKKELDRLLRRAVLGASRGQAFVGAHLSGGIDSSALSIQLDRLARAGALGHTRAALMSMVYPGEDCDETTYIDAVASRLSLPSLRFEPTFATLDELSWITSRLDYPFVSQHGTAPCRLVRHIASVGGCVLTGEGGDELFEPTARALVPWRVAARDLVAWSRYVTRRWWDRPVSGSLLGQARHLLEPFLPAPWVEGIARWRGRTETAWDTPVDPDWAKVLRPTFSASPRAPAVRTLALAMTVSGEWSASWDWSHFTAIFWGVEHRHPLASPAVLEFCNRLPLGLLDGQDRVNRRLLRAATRPELPDIVAERIQKAEFSAPTLRVLRARVTEQNLRPGARVEVVSGRSVVVPSENCPSIWPYETALAILLWASGRPV